MIDKIIERFFTELLKFLPSSKEAQATILIITFLLFMVLPTLSKLILTKLFSEKTSVRDLGYFYRNYKSNIYSHFSAVSIVVPMFALAGLGYIIESYKRPKLFSFASLFLCFLSVLFLYCFYRFLIRKEKSIKIRKEHLTTYLTTISGIFLSTIITFISTWNFRSLWNFINLPDDTPDNIVTQYLGAILISEFLINILLSLLISFFIAKKLYKIVVILEHKEYIEKFNKKQEITALDLDELNLMLIKIKILRVNIPIKKLMSIHGRETQALFIPQDTIHSLDYIEQLEKKMKNKPKSLFKQLIALFDCNKQKKHSQR